MPSTHHSRFPARFTARRPVGASVDVSVSRSFCIAGGLTAALLLGGCQRSEDPPRPADTGSTSPVPADSQLPQSSDTGAASAAQGPTTVPDSQASAPAGQASASAPAAAASPSTTTSAP